MEMGVIDLVLDTHGWNGGLLRKSNDKPVREGFSTNLYGEGSGEQ